MAYPASLDSFSAKVDDVNDVMAVDVNELQTAIAAIETELGTDPAGTVTDVKTRLAHSINAAGYLEFDDSAALTIAAGVITITQNFHRVDTEATASADYLDSILGSSNGMVLFIRIANSDRNVILRNDIVGGNIYCAGATDITLDVTGDVAVLVYDGTFTKWLAGKMAAGTSVTGNAVAGQVGYYSAVSTLTGNAELTFSTTAGLVVNESGGTAVDTRIESDGKANIFFVDASADKIGIDTAAPTVGIISIGGNAAAVVGMERHATANTAGNLLTLSAGGATSAATDKDGGGLTLTPGTSTGTGKTSIRMQRRARASSTGTSDNTASDALIIPAVKNLTNNSAIGLFEVALAAGAYAGGTLNYTVTISDGTDFQVHTGQCRYAAVRKVDTVTSEITDAVTADDSDAFSSAATLAETWAVTADTGNNKITISVNFNSSLTPTIMRLYYVLHNGSAQAITQL